MSTKKPHYCARWHNAEDGIDEALNEWHAAGYEVHTVAMADGEVLVVYRLAEPAPVQVVAGGQGITEALRRTAERHRAMEPMQKTEDTG